MFIRRFNRWPFEDFENEFFELDRIRRDLNRVLMEGAERGEDRQVAAGVYPLMNVTEDHDNYYVRSEIPGVALDELEVAVTSRGLTVAGERTIPLEDSNVKYHRKEREAGKFRRQVNFPTEIDSEKVEAKFRHGILMVVLPKTESVKPRTIAVSG